MKITHKQYVHYGLFIMINKNSLNLQICNKFKLIYQETRRKELKLSIRERRVWSRWGIRRKNRINVRLCVRVKMGRMWMMTMILLLYKWGNLRIRVIHKNQVPLRIMNRYKILTRKKLSITEMISVAYSKFKYRYVL